MNGRAFWPLLGGLLTAGAVLSCDTEASCFGDCGEESTTTTVTGVGGSSASLMGTGGALFNNDGGNGGSCTLTNGGVELCDGVDNNCDGHIDEGIDMNDIQTCGTCDNNCYTQLLNADVTTIKCDWDGTENVPGTCSFTECATDYFDLDGDGLSCEYYCIKSAEDDADCNNKDDDCDGFKDEDVDLCGDASNCGVCGGACAVVHGTGKCLNEGTSPCNATNTQCAIAQCDDDDADGWPDWWDLDLSYATGCEYQCSLTNGGIEICGDGIDNDCDGKIDGADDKLSGDPQLGIVCYGDPDGLCATSAHAGLTVCVGQQIVCDGPNVLFEDDQTEICDGIDNDCNGVIDDNATDAGGTCGQSDVFPCSKGTEVCQSGQLKCVGAVNPSTELCNGVDDDCDGTIDSAMGNPPADATGSCNVPTPPPTGATSPCMAGTKACVGGVVACQGWVGPSSSTDGCGDDSNCDGVLSNQPDLQTDPANCGTCGNDCVGTTVHAQWSCAGANCQFDGCEPNYYDLDNDQSCEYACINSGAEVCDGLDNDCNGQIDDGLTAPAVVDVCGVSPAATRAECTTMVSVACVSGSWSCTFPTDVCDPNCASATEVCDALDNDCDGGFNENVSNFGLSCASDDGLPAPGHGACRTTGVYVCDGANATKCTAVKESCANVGNGCEEVCDGQDNDCDGYVDESFEEAMGDTAYFVKPDVTKLSANLWMFSYEASRPDASATTSGVGNGYHCTDSDCPSGIPPAPPGTVPDATPACSVPGRLPWFNVTPYEVEQTCDAIGGYICSLSDWQFACQTGSACTWGYGPQGAACGSAATSNKYCNLADFDFDAVTAGIQNGLLLTGSSSLMNCGADWAGAGTVFDITGNLREITKNGSNVYPLLGGAFNTLEAAATCDFDFYVADQDFQLLDTGFRCCFDTDPTL